MEKKCRVCGAPMTRTSTGYECTFCANTEPLDERDGTQTIVKNSTKTVKRKINGTTFEVPAITATHTITHAVPKPAKRIYWKIIVFLIFIVAFCVGIITRLTLVSDDTSDEDAAKTTMETEVSSETDDDGTLFSSVKTETAPSSALAKQILEVMFDKPFDEITEQEFAGIKYIATEKNYSDGYFYLYYSFEDYKDYEAGELAFEEVNVEEPISQMSVFSEEFLQTVRTLQIPRESVESSDISEVVGYLKGVTALDLEEYEDPILKDYTSLTYLDCTQCGFDNLKEARLPVESIEVLVTSGENSFSDIGEYTALRKLSVVGAGAEAISNIATCQSLEALYWIGLSGTQSLQPMEQLTNLKTLYIDGGLDSVKDLSVIENLTGLINLAIIDTEILDINFVSGLSGLKSLIISENDMLQDFSAIGNLTGLESLCFDIGALHGNQPEYDGIKNLKNLKHLSVHTVYNLDFLYELTDLETLEVDLCFYNYLLEPIRQMTHLKELTLVNCNSQYPDGFACLSELKELRSLTVEGMQFDDPVDGLFALQNLEELKFASCKFYSAPSYVAANENLKTLEMSFVEFITMPGRESEYYYVGYNDPEITGYVLNQFGSCTNLEELCLDGYLVTDLSFLSGLSQLKSLSLERCELTAVEPEYMQNCVSLQEINLQDNTISNVDFAAKLPNLVSINIKNCYVSDLTPLQACTRLQYVDASGNPISENPLSGVVVETGE